MIVDEMKLERIVYMNWSDYFTYDGLNLWRKRDERRNNNYNSRNEGVLCGTSDKKGYLLVSFDGRRFKAHRIIWEMHNGPIPEGMEIDHINHVKYDNRIENLRLASRSDQSRNMPKSISNKSGVVGVCFNKARGKWFSQIKVDGKTERLYYGYSFEEAVKARLDAELRLGFHENHGA